MRCVTTLVLIALALSQASAGGRGARAFLRKLRARGRALEDRGPRERTAATSDACARREAARGACFDADNNFLEALCGERVVAAWLANYSADALQLAARVELASWNYESNITDETAEQVRKSAIAGAPIAPTSPLLLPAQLWPYTLAEARSVLSAAGGHREGGLAVGQREVHRNDPLPGVALLEQVAVPNAQVSAIQRGALR